MSTKKVLIPLADGFEEVEAITLIDLLRRAELDVQTVSIHDRKGVDGAHSIRVEADSLLSDLNASSWDAVILPGGMPGTLNLKASEVLKKVVLDAVERGAAYGAICAAPTVLAEWGLLKGKPFTCYPGFEEQVVGSTHSTDKVVQEGNCITSRGVGTAIDYACAWVEYLLDRETAETLRERILA